MLLKQLVMFCLFCFIIKRFKNSWQIIQMLKKIKTRCRTNILYLWKIEVFFLFCSVVIFLRYVKSWSLSRPQYSVALIMSWNGLVPSWLQDCCKGPEPHGMTRVFTWLELGLKADRSSKSLKQASNSPALLIKIYQRRTVTTKVTFGRMSSQLSWL